MSVETFIAAVARALEAAEIPFMLTGSIAAALHGTPRATQDIDLVIEATAAQLDHLVEALTAARLYVSREAAHEALANQGQFNAIDPTSGWKIDFIIRKARPFSETEFGRRIATEAFGVPMAVATIEDLILAKLEWSGLGDSELQRRDVAELLEVAGPDVDMPYLEKWIESLGLQSTWRRVRSRAEG